MCSGFQICETLKPKERCIRLRAYNEGRFDELYHEHIPAYKIGNEACIELMKALVVRFSGFSAEYIVRGYLNQRRGQPACANLFRFHTEYPEPGVIRHYCGGNVQTWSDLVIAPSRFRQL
jgi:hypothetical protein